MLKRFIPHYYYLVELNCRFVTCVCMARRSTHTGMIDTYADSAHLVSPGSMLALADTRVFETSILIIGISLYIQCCDVRTICI